MRILDLFLIELLDFFTDFITIEKKITIFKWLYKKGSKDAAVVLATIYIWNKDVKPDFNLAKKYLLDADQHGIKKASIYIKGFIESGMWNNYNEDEVLVKYRKMKEKFK